MVSDDQHCKLSERAGAGGGLYVPRCLDCYTVEGNDAWLYTGTGTIQLGFTGAGYEQSNNGHRVSYVSALNNQGQVAGYSNRYSGVTYLG